MKRVSFSFFSFILLTIITGFSPLQAHAQSSLLYVSNQNDNTVSVINPLSGNTIATIPVGNQPSSIVYNGHYVYVANYFGNGSGGGSISVIDPVTNTVITTIPTDLSGTERLTLSPDKKLIYIAGGSNPAVVYVIDTTTNTLVNTISANFNEPDGTAISPDGTKLYVVSQNASSSNGYVSVIDTSNYSLIATIPVSYSPSDIAITPDGSKLYVDNWGGPNTNNTVAVIDTSTNTVTNTISSVLYPYSVAVNSAGTYSYVVDNNFWFGGSNGDISVIDTSNDAVVTSIPIGNVPADLTISPDNSTVYVANEHSNTISVINTATNTVTNTINTGNAPWGVALVPSQAVTLTPTADTYIKNNDTNMNEGASTFLRINSGNNRALVQFNESQIASAVSSSTNYTATLQLTITSSANLGLNGRQIDVDRMLQSWTEGNGFHVGNTNPTRGTGSGATWNCATDTNIANQKPDCSGSTVWDMSDSSSWPFVSTSTATTTISKNQTGTVSFDVTSDIQSFLNGTNTNDGWLIKLDNENLSGTVEFGSKESSSSPMLIITPH